MILSFLILWQLINRFPTYTYQPDSSNIFVFSGSYPAFFVVTQTQSMNLTNATISCTFSLNNSPDCVFRYGGQGIGNNGPRPASARFYLATTPQYHNQGTGSTNYWFNSNWVEIGTNITILTLTANLNYTNWSDAGGCLACPPSTEDNFNYAVSNVVVIGLAFGGGDFYDVGIATTSGSSQLTIESFKVNPVVTLSQDLQVLGGFILNTYDIEQSEDLNIWHSSVSNSDVEFYRTKLH